MTGCEHEQTFATKLSAMFFASKIIFTALCLITIIVPSIMDLNSTHMTNPAWPAHARLHWAISYFSTTVINLLALYLLWGSYAEKDAMLVTWFAGLAPVFFWGMFFPALLLPGTGTWPDGVVPPTSFPKLFLKIHPNFILSVLITVLAGVGIWLDLSKR